MEQDMKTALAVSLIQSKPDDIDIVDYVVNIQTKIMNEENERFVEVFMKKIFILIHINTEYLFYFIVSIFITYQLSQIL